MLAVVIVLIVVVALLATLTTGLLRSHADIIKALHDLGVGVGDPSAEGLALRTPVDVPVDLRARMGPPLPSGRSSASAPDLSGVDPFGDPLVVSMAASDLTLVAFLSSGCSTCGMFWSALGDPRQLALLPPGLRTVIVTRGPEMESPV